MPIFIGLVRLFNFFYKRFNKKQAVANEIPKQIKGLQERMDDDGIFTFFSYGFSIKMEEENPIVFWTSIEAMFGYKENHSATGLICLDIFFAKGNHVKITESTPGW